MGWQEKLERGGLVLIDGGTGSELDRRGVQMSEGAWSGSAVMTAPEVLQQVHEDFIDAGAEVIIANTFAMAGFQLAPAGLGDSVGKLARKAVELAMRARDKAKHEVAIAGSISNMPPFLDLDAFPDPEREAADYRELAGALAEAGVDLIAVEMMEDVEHGEPATRAALETGLPVWLGVSCRQRPEDGRLVSHFASLDFETPLDGLIPLGPAVVNVMHSQPAAVTAAMDMVRERWQGPIGVYPEVGFEGDPNYQGDGTSPEELARHARDWVAQGARLLGGCCGAGPEHIRALRDALPDLQP